MGRVYRALDREQGRHVALKLLAENTPDHLVRFAEEARILESLAHPGVVRWVAHGEDTDGRRWLALEWLEGEDLAARIARGPLGVEDSLAIGIAAAEALAAAHAHGVLHRDIKPSNLFLVDNDPRHTKLLDFGVARRDNSATRAITRSGVVVGTAGYIPPEHIRGERTDARADVFGLGTVLFECLSGQPAFAGGSMVAVLRRLLVDEPPPLRRLRYDVPPELDAVIASMLAKEPSARPIDAIAVADALRRLYQESSRRRTNEPEGSDAFSDGEQQNFAVDTTYSNLGLDCETNPGSGNALDPSHVFVGRERELNTLLALFEECVGEGMARVVLITGPAGIGKSRLGHETVQRIRAMVPETVVWTARGEIAVGMQGVEGEPTPPNFHKASAFLHHATAALEDKPLALVLEDLQWADGASVLAIEQALDQLRDRPLFVLALARPEVHARFSRLWSERDVQEINLGGLPPRAAMRMVQHSLGDATDEAAVRALVRRAGGHPFYLEELIRAAAGGRSDVLPRSVLAMVQARLALLTSEERRFLRAASIFGDVFWVRGVRYLLGGGLPTVAQTLIDRNFLTRNPTSRWPGEEELSFRETLVRETAYATISSADRVRGHALAKAWLETVDGTHTRVIK